MVGGVTGRGLRGDRGGRRRAALIAQAPRPTPPSRTAAVAATKAWAWGWTWCPSLPSPIPYRRTHLRSEPLPRMSKCVRQRLGHLPPHVRDPRLAVVSTCSRGIGDHSRWPHLWAHSRNSWCWLPGASRLRQVRIRYAVTFARTVRLATTSGAHLLRDRDHLPELEVGATERSALALGGPRLRTYPPPGRRRVPSGHPQGAATVRV